MSKPDLDVQADRILTRAEYELAVEQHFRQARDRMMGRLRVLNVRIFKEKAMAEWDAMAREEGERVDLNTREWGMEQADDVVAGIRCGIFQIVKDERGL